VVGLEPTVVLATHFSLTPSYPPRTTLLCVLPAGTGRCKKKALAAVTPATRNAPRGLARLPCLVGKNILFVGDSWAKQLFLSAVDALDPEVRFTRRGSLPVGTVQC